VATAYEVGVGYRLVRGLKKFLPMYLRSGTHTGGLSQAFG